MTVFCTFVPAVYQYFMAFNKTMIIEIPVSVWQGREHPMLFELMRTELVALHRTGKHLIIANNKFHKIHTETLIPQLANQIPYVPNLGLSSKVFWQRPQSSTLLFLFSRGHWGGLAEYFHRNYGLVSHEMGFGWNWNQIFSYDAVVLIPYEPSQMTFFELYRCGVPLFIPSKQLFTQGWEQTPPLTASPYASIMLKEQVNWRIMKSVGVNGSDILDRPELWETYFDFYNEEEFPGLNYFNNWTDLAEQLSRIRDNNCTNVMKVGQIKRQSKVEGFWRKWLYRLPSKSEESPRTMNFREAINALYNITYPPDGDFAGVSLKWGEDTN